MRIEEIGSATLINADCRDAMAFMDENSIDAVVCDPPYGIGFMGKGWDHGVPGIEFWQAALRIAKPGAHMLAFGGTRTFHRLMVAIEDAGWEIRDTLMWVYGSGMPKSKNLHDDWEGWGTALKPAWEPIILARKPLVGTVAANAAAHGTGVLNIDGCRVGGSKNVPASVSRGTSGVSLSGSVDNSLRREDGTGSGHDPNTGRWPANLIHDGSEEVLLAFPHAPGQQAKASTSDTQRAGQNTYGAMTRGSNGAEPRGDAGSAARFFYCAKASRADRDEGMEDAPDRILAMSGGAAAAARGEQYNNGDSGMNQTKVRKNHHPTVKPTELMRYLCRLVTPPGGLVLDPFMGSGSTGKAAILEGFRFVGIDDDEEHGYFDVACARIRHATLNK